MIKPITTFEDPDDGPVTEGDMALYLAADTPLGRKSAVTLKPAPANVSGKTVRFQVACSIRT